MRGMFLLGALMGGPICSAQVAQGGQKVQAAAQQVPVPPLAGHVIDQTNTLTSEHQDKIEQALATFEARKGSQLAVLLVPSTQPETVEQYALRVAEQQPQEVQDGLFLATDNDVVAYLDLIES